MSKVWRVRIDPEVLTRAHRVTKRLSTSTQEMVRIFVAKIAETGAVPLELKLPDDSVATPWEMRASALEKFYDQAKGR